MSPVELRQDLAGLKIKLENFYGPIDLLLDLARENEINITELTIGNVIDQYVALIRGLKGLNIDVSADFIYFASQLLLVKARVVIPFAGEEEGAEEDMVPHEFIKKLLEYKKIKVCMEWVENRISERSRIHAGPGFVRTPGVHEELPLKGLTLFAVASSYATISGSIGLTKPMEIFYTDIPIEEYISKILVKLAGGEPVDLASFLGSFNLKDTVGNMLAVLELVKREQVKLDIKDKDVVFIQLRGQTGTAGEPAHKTVF